MPQAPPAQPLRLAVLGSTGSIGVAALAVAAAFPERLKLVGLAANANWSLLREQIERHRPAWACLCDAAAAPAPPPAFAGMALHLGGGKLADLARGPDSDLVLNAIVGAAGLESSLAALSAGKALALANKETLVCGGELVLKTADAHGGSLLPVDSEHSGIFQILSGREVGEVERVVLTASGGPFRGRKRRDLEKVTVEEALRHPTWKMGRKITIDSATLINKALEIIEARWLFGLAPEQIDVVLHPESIVHSFVEFKDGSVIAQLSPPDMKLPIQAALLWPERLPGPARRLCWSELRQLTFEPPDRETFPALQLGLDVARRGGTAGAALIAADEAAVERFFAGSLAFLDIAAAAADVVERHPFVQHPTLPQLRAADAWARQEVLRWRP